MKNATLPTHGWPHAVKRWMASTRAALRTAIAALALLLATPPALAQAGAIDASLSPADKGRAIAIEAERRRAGFVDAIAELTMELVGSEDRVRTRRLTWRTLESVEPGAGDRSLTVFHEPRDIAGTAFLSHTYIDRNDDQWLYLPSLKRVRRIASANLSSAFVGSEFSYEDLLSDEPDKFDQVWLRDEPCATGTCFVLERRPRYADSGYSRQIVWIDQDAFRPMRIDYYDQRERLQKTLTLEDYRKYLDRFWRAHELRMDNHLTGRTTVLRFEPFELQSGLAAELFEPGTLTRLR